MVTRFTAWLVFLFSREVNFVSSGGNKIFLPRKLKNDYQICALFFLSRKSLSPFFTLNALYQASICGKAALTRAPAGE